MIMILLLLGWMLIASSQLVKFIVKNEEKRIVIELILSAAALGVLIGGALSQIKL